MIQNDLLMVKSFGTNKNAAVTVNTAVGGGGASKINSFFGV
jgi:hypothetical protein